MEWNSSETCRLDCYGSKLFSLKKNYGDAFVGNIVLVILSLSRLRFMRKNAIITTLSWSFLLFCRRKFDWLLVERIYTAQFPNLAIENFARVL